MKISTRLATLSSVSALIFSLAFLATGCNDRSKPQIRTNTGKIKDVDLATKRATLEFVRKKDGQIIQVPGQASSDTKLTINGRLADLKEVHGGDEATITGYYDSSLDTFIATVIEITRPEELSAASQPTSKPASKPAKS